jgi:hypothetical protein
MDGKLCCKDLGCIEKHGCGRNEIIGVGAEGGTRTPTSLSPLDPEPSASANSATSALRAVILCMMSGLVKLVQTSNISVE